MTSNDRILVTLDQRFGACGTLEGMAGKLVPIQEGDTRHPDAFVQCDLDRAILDDVEVVEEVRQGLREVVLAAHDPGNGPRARWQVVPVDDIAMQARAHGCHIVYGP